MAGGVHHRQHRQAEALRQVGRAGFAVKQAHGAFHNDQVGLLRRRVQARRQSASPVIHRSSLVHRRAAGQSDASTGPGNPART